MLNLIRIASVVLLLSASAVVNADDYQLLEIAVASGKLSIAKNDSGDIAGKTQIILSQDTQREGIKRVYIRNPQPIDPDNSWMLFKPHYNLEEPAPIRSNLNSNEDIKFVVLFPDEAVYLNSSRPGKQPKLKGSTFPINAEYDDPFVSPLNCLELQFPTRLKVTGRERFVLFQPSVNQNATGCTNTGKQGVGLWRTVKFGQRKLPLLFMGTEEKLAALQEKLEKHRALVEQATLLNENSDGVNADGIGEGVPLTATTEHFTIPLLDSMPYLNEGDVVYGGASLNRLSAVHRESDDHLGYWVENSGEGAETLNIRMTRDTINNANEVRLLPNNPFYNCDRVRLVNPPPPISCTQNRVPLTLSVKKGLVLTESDHLTSSSCVMPADVTATLDNDAFQYYCYQVAENDNLINAQGLGVSFEDSSEAARFDILSGNFESLESIVERDNADRRVIDLSPKIKLKPLTRRIKVEGAPSELRLIQDAIKLTSNDPDTFGVNDFEVERNNQETYIIVSIEFQKEFDSLQEARDQNGISLKAVSSNQAVISFISSNNNERVDTVDIQLDISNPNATDVVNELRIAPVSVKLPNKFNIVGSVPGYGAKPTKMYACRAGLRLKKWEENRIAWLNLANPVLPDELKAEEIQPNDIIEIVTAPKGKNEKFSCWPQNNFGAFTKAKDLTSDIIIPYSRPVFVYLLHTKAALDAYNRLSSNDLASKIYENWVRHLKDTFESKRILVIRKPSGIDFKTISKPRKTNPAISQMNPAHVAQRVITNNIDNPADIPLKGIFEDVKEQMRIYGYAKHVWPDVVIISNGSNAKKLGKSKKDCSYFINEAQVHPKSGAKIVLLRDIRKPGAVSLPFSKSQCRHDDSNSDKQLQVKLVETVMVEQYPQPPDFDQIINFSLKPLVEQD